MSKRSGLSLLAVILLSVSPALEIGYSRKRKLRAEPRELSVAKPRMQRDLAPGGMSLTYTTARVAQALRLLMGLPCASICNER